MEAVVLSPTNTSNNDEVFVGDNTTASMVNPLDRKRSYDS